MAKQRRLTHEHTLQIGDRTDTQCNHVCSDATRIRLRFCVCVYMRVSPAPPLYRDIARRHKDPLYMLRRKHYQFTQKPLCLQAWGGEGGGGVEGLAGTAPLEFGLDIHLSTLSTSFT